jgi:hypothetical protein
MAKAETHCYRNIRRGLEALDELIGQLPTDIPAAIFIRLVFGCCDCSNVMRNFLYFYRME